MESEQQLLPVGELFVSSVVNNPDFKAGVMALANLLQIQRHDDYLMMLKVSTLLMGRPLVSLLYRPALCCWFRLGLSRPGVQNLQPGGATCEL